MFSLFGGRIEPLTSEIGFVNTSFDRAIWHFQTLMENSRQPGSFIEVNTALEQALLDLQPLTVAWRPNILLTHTKLPGWIALFDADKLGQSARQSADFLARHTNAAHYGVAYSQRERGKDGPLASRILDHSRPGDKRIKRSVYLIENNPGRWEFGTFGPVQPYEDLDAYANRRKTERFTPEMLQRYTAAVGLYPWDEDFYQPPFLKITNDKPISDEYKFTLAQVREFIGFQDA